MNVVFKDKHLELLEGKEAGKLNYPVSVLNSARRKLTVLRAAPDERTIRNWKSLHYEKLSGDRAGQHSIRLNDQWRLVFELDKESNPPSLFVIGIENYH